jgi:hypothetical protein
MDEKTEREMHELVLAVVAQGRQLAQEWEDVGLISHGTTKPFVLGLLKALRGRHGLGEIDEARVRLLGEHIRKFTNEYREGLGDRALETDVDTTAFYDDRTVDLINLAWRWRQFRNALAALDDKVAAIRETQRLLTEI